MLRRSVKTCDGRTMGLMAGNICSGTADETFKHLGSVVGIFEKNACGCNMYHTSSPDIFNWRSFLFAFWHESFIREFSVIVQGKAALGCIPARFAGERFRVYAGEVPICYNL